MTVRNCVCAFKGPGQHNKGCFYYEARPMTPTERIETDRLYTDLRVLENALHSKLHRLARDYDVQAAADAQRLLYTRIDNALARIRQELNDRP